MDQLPDDIPELIWACPDHQHHSKLRKFLQSLLLAFAIVVVTSGIIIAVAEYSDTSNSATSDDDTNSGGSAPQSGTVFQGAVTKG
jgi:hypothetical protein